MIKEKDILIRVDSELKEKLQQKAKWQKEQDKNLYSEDDL